jgi:hypothetical protein
MGHGSTISMWLVALLIIVVWPLFFILLWSAILFFMSAAGGWRRLARKYAAKETPAGGRSFSWISGMVGIARYNRTLLVTVTEAGIYVKTRRIFSFSHPPLFIPWSEIHKPQRYSFLRWEYVTFEIGAPKVAWMRLESVVFDGTPIAAAMHP